ncbi:Uncharacterised protein [uncultured archaeon]|nr:Uncharacterised protein [uncultured archaeon]
MAVHYILASDLDLLFACAYQDHCKLWGNDGLEGLELLGILLLIDEWRALLYLPGPGDKACGKCHTGLLTTFLAVGLGKLLVKVKRATFLHGSQTSILSQLAVSGVLASMSPIRDWVISCT